MEVQNDETIKRKVGRPKGIPAWNKGSHFIMREETKQKISEGCKRNGVGKWLLGRAISQEERSKTSKRMLGNTWGFQKGQASPNKGKTYLYKSRPSMKGRKIWNEGMIGIFVGSRASNWQGGKTLVEGYRYRMSSRPYILRKRGVSGFHTIEQWTNLKKQYDFMCLCCKKCEPEIILTEDHILPISKGGTNDISNIQPLCRSCNSQKYRSYIDYRFPIIELREKETV